MSFFLKSIFLGSLYIMKILIDSIKNWIDRIYETMFGKKYVDEDDADRETTHFFNNFDELETKDL
jgi:hypothetical protein